MKPASDWYYTDGSGLFPQQQRTVYEKPVRLVLYDKNGKLMAKKRQPLGFRPEDAK